MQQYMFGDSFLTGAFADTMYLPKGRWIDYWTGQTYSGEQELACQVPEDRGGPLFVRAGAIIPYWPDMDYVGQKPVDTIGLHVYPDGRSSFTLFEDDGVTYDYLEGAVAATEITCSAAEQAVTLTIDPRAGDYAGMPEIRFFDICLHSEAAPKQVLLNGEPLVNPDASPCWSYHENVKELRLKAKEDPDRRESIVILCLYE